MKSFLIASCLSLICMIASAQKIPKDKLLGCWEFVEYVDTLYHKSLGITPHSESLEFQSDGTYNGTYRSGDYEIQDDMLILYKTKFTQDDLDFAEYMGQTPRDITSMELMGLKITTEYLFYKVASEEEPFQLLAKFEKKNCR